MNQCEEQSTPYLRPTQPQFHRRNVLTTRSKSKTLPWYASCFKRLNLFQSHLLRPPNHQQTMWNSPPVFRKVKMPRTIRTLFVANEKSTISHQDSTVSQNLRTVIIHINSGVETPQTLANTGSDWSKKILSSQAGI